MTAEKDKAIQRWQARKDFQSILAVRDVDDEFRGEVHSVGDTCTTDDFGHGFLYVIRKVEHLQERNAQIFNAHDNVFKRNIQLEKNNSEQQGRIQEL